MKKTKKSYLYIVMGLFLGYFAFSTTKTCHIPGLLGEIPEEVCGLNYCLKVLNGTAEYNSSRMYTTRALMFSGKAGTGKSKCIEYIEENSGAIILKYKYDEVRGASWHTTKIREIYQKADRLSKEQDKPVVVIFEDMDEGYDIPDAGLALHNPIQDHLNNSIRIFTIVTVRDWRNASGGMQSRCPVVLFYPPNVYVRIGIIHKYCKEYNVDLPEWFIKLIGASSFGKTGGDIENIIKNAAEQINNGTPLTQTEIFHQLTYENYITIGGTTTIGLTALILLIYGVRAGYIQSIFQHTKGATGATSASGGQAATHQMPKQSPLGSPTSV